eukprot:Protomagalhaensia_wolfi_Nauph_80__1864@NODE_2165_length_1190_cov_104_755864_g1663_i1_p1_GENE_NODE_2165_length_1190_cov_104_755864_g1663_i1NODE_2165_length_1190_cov_104_755864_g1663_i1_p1_ORF_typecomplete_len175_score21_54_NODE_2165_length_1190_cov_104_755864_g1663_i1100624
MTNQENEKRILQLWRRRRLRESSQFVPPGFLASPDDTNVMSSVATFTSTNSRTTTITDSTMDTTFSPKLRQVCFPHGLTKDEAVYVDLGLRHEASTRASDMNATASRLSSSPLASNEEEFDSDIYVSRRRRSVSIGSLLEDFGPQSRDPLKFVSGNHVRLVVERFALRPSNMSF